MQRDRAKTIYEKSKPGRRAFVAPELDVPKHELPEQFRRAEPPKLPEIAEPEIVRHYNRLSKRNFDLDTGFYPLGSCTMKHNPKLHERVAALPGNARLHPLQNPKRAQGALQLMYELQGALAEVAGLPHVSLQPSRRLARRARRRAAHPRLPRGPRRAAHEDPHPRHRARHQPGDGDDGRLRGRQGRHRRARRRRRRGPARQGRRRRRLPDAHQPEHARRVRPQHRGDRQDRPRRRRDAVLRRREPQRGHGPHAPGRHGLRHRALQPAQDVHPAARRRRPGRRPDRGLGPHRAVPAPSRRSSSATTARSTSTTTGRSRSAACAASRATTASSCAPTRTSCRSAPTACRRRPRPRS